MKRIFLILVLFLATIFTRTSIADEISLFDSAGQPVAYIATDDDMTIYMWSGEPVAYLSGGNSINIYGFNGEHLGWFDNGIIRDHNGDAVGFMKGAVNMYTSYEPYKSYRQYKPYKAYQQYAPYKPYNSSSFSRTPLVSFLMRGR